MLLYYLVFTLLLKKMDIDSMYLLISTINLNALYIFVYFSIVNKLIFYPRSRTSERPCPPKCIGLAGR